MLAGFWLLNQSKFQNDFGDRGNPLAVVRKSNNTVKKKSALDLGWGDALESEPFYTNDQVFTFENSTADVEFLSGASIEVAEKTLFKIQLEKGAINLDLTDGVIFAKISKKSGPLLVNIQNRQYRLESEDATVQLTRTEKASEVLVVKGSAQISNETSTIEAVENQKVELSPSAIAEEKVVTVDVTPTPFIAATPEVTPTSVPLEEPEEWTQTDFPTWTPAEGSVRIELRKPDQQVEFNWEGEEKQKYQFELSEKSDFEKILITKSVESSQTKVSFPKTGVFFWRAKKIDADGNVIFQKPVKVIVKPTPPPSKPILDEEIRLKIKKRSSSVQERIFDFFIMSANAEEKFVEIPMPDNEDAKSYKIEIYADENGKKLIKTGQTNETVYRFDNPDAGTYWFRVSIIDYWDRESPFSDFSKMIVEDFPKKIIKEKATRGQVVLISPVHGHKHISGSLTFKWKSKSEDDFIFELSDKVDFSDMKVREIVRGNSLTLSKKVLPEKFYWRVRQGGGESYKRRVVVLKGIQPKKKIVKKKPVKKEFFKKVSRIGFSYRPTLTEYKTTISSNQVTIDGTALNGVGFWYEKGRKDRDGHFNPFYQVALSRTAGEVFNTLGFSNSNVKFSYGDFLHYLPFQVLLIADIFNRSSYSVQNSSVVENSETFFAGGVGLRYPFHLLSLKNIFEGAYTGGTSSRFLISWKVDFAFNSKSSLQFGLGIESSEFDTELGTATLDEKNLEIAYLMNF